MQSPAYSNKRKGSNSKSVQFENLDIYDSPDSTPSRKPQKKIRFNTVTVDDKQYAYDKSRRQETNSLSVSNGLKQDENSFDSQVEGIQMSFVKSRGRVTKPCTKDMES